MTTKKKPPIIKLIKYYRAVRAGLNLNQQEFWSRLGVTQSGGSRYENGREVPKAVAILAHLVYIKGEDIDAHHFA